MSKSLSVIPNDRAKSRREEPLDFGAYLTSRIVGQDEAIWEIVPYLEMYQANLNPIGRPAGVFLLLGPTGTGKTRTAEVVAEALHGSDRHLLRVDCGEYQMEHEVAKLVGAPPGYLGHKETQAVLSQQRLEAVTSECSRLSVVLFDEIEKAAPSMQRILLGILDKAFLRTGDNHPVNFENSMIFLSSNLGAKEMAEQTRPGLGFAGHQKVAAEKLRATAMHAVRKRFAPEFLNRIDATVTYQPLTREAMETILEHQLTAVQNLLDVRLGLQTFCLRFTAECREFLLRKGVSDEFGARELKRIVQRHVLQPVASLVVQRRIPAGRRVEVGFDPELGNTTFKLLR
jgi:ATP-dependent Clp protease ATP-binding subunit ClpA